ncbi:hypothetical protein [Sphingomicrobium flavum]|uniref:hypothetical protein n=1 Tax=Sphingomicrobium flavum TaxID=1229164 RepID=UPI0021ADBA07|nr:hypothetical protein [Sphingomicrobium flavum]
MKHFGPDPLESALRGELDAGEHLRWHGRAHLPSVNCAGFALWLFAIPWTAFAVFWTYMAWTGVESSGEIGPVRYAFPAFGLPFVLIGLSMMAAPLMQLFVKREIIHGITDRRLITLIQYRKRKKVKSLLPRQMGPIERWDGKNGRGKISIETGTRIDSKGRERTKSVSLIGIDNVQRVGEMVRELARSVALEA